MGWDWMDESLRTRVRKPTNIAALRHESLDHPVKPRPFEMQREAKLGHAFVPLAKRNEVLHRQWALLGQELDNDPLRRQLDQHATFLRPFPVGLIAGRHTAKHANGGCGG